MVRLFNLSAMLGRPPKAPAPETTPGVADNIRLALESESEDAKPRSLISVLGDVPPNVGEMVESVAVACRAAGKFPVAVLSELRPELIAISTVPIEFIPPREYLPVGADAYDRYVRRRWSLIIGKWDVSTQIDLALGFEAFLAAELQRPMAAARRLNTTAG